MEADTVWVALVTEVFPQENDIGRLTVLLREAADRGADLAVLPELPFNAWVPASRTAHTEDAEPPAGRRQRRMAEAAREVGVALLGGAIVQDPVTGSRHNTALLYGPDGELLHSYRKVHLPEEEGYWETSHYEPGTEAPGVCRALPMTMGVQVCSDVNRPTGFELLAAQGAAVVLAPRATPPESYERWKLVLRANAAMTASYVISVNRPRPERGASIGGASLAIGPDGGVIAETSAALCLVGLDVSDVTAARAEYPGYLARFPGMYATAWSALRG